MTPEGADIIARMHDGLTATLAATTAYARLLCDAAGTTPEQFAALGTEGREYVLARGRGALLRAAGVTRRAWRDMPAASAERSAVLLRGAEKLGIETRWGGWQGAAEHGPDPRG